MNLFISENEQLDLFNFSIRAAKGRADIFIFSTLFPFSLNQPSNKMLRFLPYFSDA